MGREVRKVPANWEHPKNEDGHHIPLYGMSFKEALKDFAENPSDYDNEDGKGPRKPRAEEYMPEWPESEKTHFQMYENTSEGTPISPPMESPEKLARCLADTGASAFACKTATYEEWLATIRAGSCLSCLIAPGKGLMTGPASQKFLEETRKETNDA